MKKLSIVLCALCIFASAANAEPQKLMPKNPKMMPAFDKKIPQNAEERAKMRRAHEAAFEQKLGLTEVQKLKARELRKSGHENMKPVMEDLKSKKHQAEEIRNSKLTVQEKEEKLIILDREIQALEKKAVELRKQNMKDFESILTKDQRKTLKQMKKDGREKFEKGRRVEHPLPVPIKKEIK